jgi:hypothetical protein
MGPSVLIGLSDPLAHLARTSRCGEVLERYLLSQMEALHIVDPDARYGLQDCSAADVLGDDLFTKEVAHFGNGFYQSKVYRVLNHVPRAAENLP